MKIKVVVLSILQLVLMSSLEAQDYYASPNGTGTACTSGSPCSLEEAITKVAQNTSGMSQDITVFLSGGYYFLNNPIVLNDQHSGKNGYRVIFRNNPSNTTQAIVSGGQQISGWQPYIDNPNGGPNITLYRTQVPPGTRFREFYVEEALGIRARNPNYNGNFTSPTADEYFQIVRAKNPLQINASEIANYDNLQNVELSMYREWFNIRLPVSSFSVSGGLADISIGGLMDPPYSRNFTYKDDQLSKFFVENAYELIDAPGEWYLNESTDYLYYYPRSGENMTSDIAIIPIHENFITLENASHITFMGITFAHDSWLEPSDIGYFQRQGGIRRDLTYGGSTTMIPDPGLFTLNNSHHITFERNIIKHTAANGILFYDGTHNDHVVGNVFFENGGTSIFMGTDFATPTYGIWNENISNNYFLNNGTQYLGSAAIFVTFANGVFIDHNFIDGASNLGLNTGWLNRSSVTTSAGGFKIRRNDFTRVSTKGADMAAIHTKSAAPGSEVFENYIHDIVCCNTLDLNSDAVYLLYLDDQSRYYTALDNVLENFDSDVRIKSSKGTPAYHKDLRVLQSEFPARHADIIANSGLQSTYSDILNFQTATVGLGGTNAPTNFPDLKNGYSDDFESQVVGEEATEWIQMQGEWPVVNDAGDKAISNDNGLSIFSKSYNAHGTATFSFKTPASIPSSGSFWFTLRYLDLFNSVQAGYDFADNRWKIREKRLDPTKIQAQTTTAGVHNTEPSQDLSDVEVYNVHLGDIESLSPNTSYTVSVSSVPGNADRLVFMVNGTSKAIHESINNVTPGSMGFEVEQTSGNILFDDFAFTPDANEVFVDETLINTCDSDPDCIYKNEFETENIGYSAKGFFAYGLWEIVEESGNKYYYYNPSQVVHSRVKSYTESNFNEANVEIQADFYPETVTGATLQFRFGFQEYTGYSLRHSGSKWVLQRHLPSDPAKYKVLTVPQTANTTPLANTWQTIKLVKLRNKLSAYINDNLILEYSESSANEDFMTRPIGQFGFGYEVPDNSPSGLRIDNLSILKLKILPDLDFCLTSTADLCEDLQGESTGSNAPGWQDVNGKFTVVSDGPNIHFNANGSDRNINQETTFENGSLTSKFKVDNNLNSRAVWLTIRYLDGNNSVQAGWFNGAWQIRQRQGGALTTLGSIAEAIDLDVWYDASIHARGSNIVLEINGIEKLNVNNATVLDNGSFGVWVNNCNASFDDIAVVEDLSPPELFCNTSSADYCEAFEGVISGSVPPDWTVVAGNWSVETDPTQVYQSVGSGRTTLNNQSHQNVEFSSYIKSENQGSNAFWLTARYVDSDNNIQAGYNDGQWLIRQRVGGGLSTLASTSAAGYDVTKWNKYTIEMENNQVKFFVNDVEVLSSTTAFMSAGSVGLWTYQSKVYFDAVEVNHQGLSCQISDDFCNDFEGIANGSDPSDWSEPIDWSVSTIDGVKAYSNETSSTKSFYANYNPANFVLKSRVQVSSSTVSNGRYAIWLAGRVDDVNGDTSIQVGWYDGAWRIRQRNNGSLNELGSSSSEILTEGQWYTMEVIANGSQIELIVDGVSKVSVNNASVTTAGTVVVWTYRCDAHFDIISATTN